MGRKRGRYFSTGLGSPVSHEVPKIVVEFKKSEEQKAEEMEPLNCYYCWHDEGKKVEATTFRNGYQACDECYESVDAVRGIYHLE